MSVSAIPQAHITPAEDISAGSQKAQSGVSKSSKTEVTAVANPAQQAEQTQAAATAQNNAGHEQSAPKNGGQGGRVNLYA